jgi:hypothetical protein
MNVDDTNISTDPIVGLSFRAIRYAQLIGESNAGILAQRLYSYNAEVPAEWMVKAYESKSAVEIWNLKRVLMTIAEGGQYSLSSNGNWVYAKRNTFDSQTNTRARFHYKLYVSPVYNNFRQALIVIAKLVTLINPFCFKFGNDLQGCLRPEKIVLYFEDWDQLKAAAALLEKEMVNLTPLGVPLSCPLDNRGLLSFGVDPISNQKYRSLNPVSWRVWLANKMADDITKFGSHGNCEQLLKFLRNKFRQRGLDMNCWTILSDFNY